MMTLPLTAISEIRSVIQTIREDTNLYKSTNFNDRADAIDLIDFHVINRIEGLLHEREPGSDLQSLQFEAERIKVELGKIDTVLYSHLREKIRTGIAGELSFRDMIGQYVEHWTDGSGGPDQLGYDNLDVFINGLLSDQAIPETTMEREPEMVFFQKTPARIIFQMAAHSKPCRNDVFVDIGSGLGQVAILMNLISGVKAVGIEYEPAFCNYAIACLSRLNLPDVTFINLPAHKADYSRGTIFFMYTPFEGSMLQEMLEILHQESLKRTIRIFTYGPCSAVVARQSWLFCTNGEANDVSKLYEFRPEN